MQESTIFLNDGAVHDFSVSVVDGDIISIDGIEGSPFVVSLSSHIEKKLIAFNKPVGYVVSLADGHNQTIYDLLPSEFSSFRYIGRLDKNSHGLLLLSNDLDLVHRLSHPRFGSKKHYIVKLDKAFLSQDIVKCRQGVLDDGELLRVVDITQEEDTHVVRIVLQEGKNRHIRRMLSALGYDILDLCRISQGDIALGDLPSGDWKYASI